MRTREQEFSFEIVEHIGVISKTITGWNKELNIVSWNGRKKYDLRDWDENHERMSRGITLTADEMRQLVTLLKGVEPKLEEVERWQENV